MSAVILAHGDADGVTAAAVARAALGAGDVVFTHPAGLLGDFREFARGYQLAVIVDVSLDEASLAELAAELRRFPGRVIYIDHHPLPPRGFPGAPNVVLVHEEGPCAAELAFRHFRPAWEMSRVALYGAIGDHALGTPWVREAMASWDIKTLYLEAGVLTLALERIGRNHDEKRRIVASLARGELPSSIPGLVHLALEQARAIEEMRLKLPGMLRTSELLAVVINPPASVGAAAFYAAVVSGKPVGVAVEERRGLYVGSARARDPRVDLNAALRASAVEVGGTGGGHPQAAGFRVPADRFEGFLALLEGALRRQLQAQA